MLPEDNPQESSLRHMNLQHSSDILSLRRYISQSISSRFSRRLSSFSLTVELISGIKISAKAFLTVKRQELLSTCDVYVDNEQAHLVEKSASLVDEGRRPVSKDNVCTAFPLGDDTAVFTKLEIGNIRLFKDATLSIIGFKPEFSYPLWANLRPPICIYPTEEGVVGSTRLLTAIYLQIKARKVVGLGWFYSRRNASPCVVMITAGSQSYHGPESKAKLNSLFLIPLPFAEDIRPTVRDQCSNVSTALVNSMTVIIQQLQLAGSTYDPRKYSNPGMCSTSIVLN